MTIKPLAVAGLCLLSIALAAPEARAQNDEACRAVLTARKVPQDGADPCFLLGVFVWQTLTKDQAAEILRPDSVPVGAIFSQRDLQNRVPQPPALSGTPAQGHAVPGVQPAGVATGTIAALGTDAGQDAIAALSLNPAVLFLAEAATEQLARLSRLADVTVFIPVSGITEDPPTGSDRGKLRYFGARVRLNLTGASAGSTVWNAAERLLRARISDAARTAASIETLLRETSDVRACAEALLDARTQPAVTAACGAPFGFTPDMDQARQLREALTSVRREADSKYFGADLRVDFGDPTMGAVEDARGQYLFAGLAIGRRFAGSGATSSGFRGRLGLRHAKLDTADKAELAAEGGVGFELSRYLGDDELNVSTAIEFRYGNAPANLTDRFQTDFTMLRGSILLPVTTGNSVSINVGAPIAGDVSPIFSVNFNWGLLLSDQPGAR